MTFIDDVVGVFSPRAKLRRVKDRRKLSILEKRYYQGAKKSRRTEGWYTSGTSADAEIAAALPTLRDRSRDLVRNNSYAARGMQVIQVNVVGKGIRPAISAKSERVEKKIKSEWIRWAETPMCDFDGKHDIYGLQSLIMRAIAESGEILVRKRFTKDGLKLQVLESDYLVTEQGLSVETSVGGNYVSQGIEYDSLGQVVAYHLHREHPGSLGLDVSFDSSYDRIRVPKDEILHLFRQDRPNQNRGVPWLSNCMQRLKDFDDYEQAQLIRQKLSACYMAFVSDIDGAELTEDEEEMLEKFEPGAIEMLPPGKSIDFAKPPEVSENYGDYTRVMLQAVATGLGVSYEALTGNLKDINFSSSRMGWLEFQRNIDFWRKTLMVQGFCEPIFSWFLESLMIDGVNTTNVSSTWTPPSREMIDPTKEVPSTIDQITYGIKTLSEVLLEQGKNPEDHFEALRRERETLDSLGVTLENINASEGDIDEN
jgi:lambda family phage portal protein